MIPIRFHPIAGTALLALAGLFTGTGAVRADTDFPKGTQSFSLSGAYTQERTGESQYLASLNVARGFYFRDNAAVEVQAPIYFAHDEENASGIGLQAVARYHFFNVKHISFYADILGGILWTSEDFPTGGTEFNFTYAGGPGASFRLYANMQLMTGFRFQHVSNGFIEGRDRNPIMNSLGGYVGLSWLF